MKILFETLGSEAWMGGVNYIKNLAYAVRLAESGHKLVHFGYFDQNLYGKELSPDGVLIWQSPYRQLPASIQKLILKLQKKFPSIVQAFTRLLKAPSKLDMPDIVFHTNTKDLPIKAPRIWWIPDFQHLARPEFFATEEIQARNHIFKNYVQTANIILLSSEDSRSLFSKFYPKHANKARIYKFVPRIQRLPSTAEMTASLERFSLPSKFIFMPNQFWIHKNHMLVLDALELLKSTTPEIRIVMSGSMQDHRWPDHGSKVISEITRRNLSEMVLVLGVIPYPDVQNIFRAAHAILNPSKYEGWSTTVEEAKTMNKMILASDIGVHKEQLLGLSAGFFSPDDASELAAQIVLIWSKTSPTSRPDQEILEDNEKACREAGQQFLAICREAIGSNQ